MNEDGVIDYYVVAELDPGSQSKKVSEMLVEGWELYGMPTSYVADGICVFVQAMVKREKQNG